MFALEAEETRECSSVPQPSSAEQDCMVLDGRCEKTSEKEYKTTGRAGKKKERKIIMLDSRLKLTAYFSTNCFSAYPKTCVVSGLSVGAKKENALAKIV